MLYCNLSLPLYPLYSTRSADGTLAREAVRGFGLDLAQPDKLKARVRAKGNTTKTIVALAVEILEPKGFGRIRLQRVVRDSEEYLLPFVRQVVQRGSTVHTDGSFAYSSLTAKGYRHLRTVVGGSGVPAHESMPGVHGVASLLKRWLLGTHHGAVQPAQLDHYLDEFVFRFNRRLNEKSTIQLKNPFKIVDSEEKLSVASTMPSSHPLILIEGGFTNSPIFKFLLVNITRGITAKLNCMLKIT